MLKVLAKGTNCPLSGGILTIVIRGFGVGVTPDLTVLCLLSSGKVRGDSDFVFFNQPRTPDGSAYLTSNGLTIDPSKAAEAIDRMVIAVALDEPLPVAASLTLTVQDGDSRHDLPTDGLRNESAIMLAEVYRRGPVWKLRNVSQGYASGLAGLTSDHGIEINEPAAVSEPSAATVRSAQQRSAARHANTSTPSSPTNVGPGWYPHPTGSSALAWWNGRRWTGEVRQTYGHDTTRCWRCGQRLRMHRFGGHVDPCRACELQIGQYMQIWQKRATDLMYRGGLHEPRWIDLWTDLRFERINDNVGEAVLRPVALQYLERMVSFAFADDIIEQHEVEAFERDVAVLKMSDPAIEAMRQRLLRGLHHAKIRDGALPQLRSSQLHLDTDEILHLDVPATHVRMLASGSRNNSGRLLATNKKLRFVAAHTGGSEITWTKIVSIRRQPGGVAVEGTASRGTGSYVIADNEYAAAVLEGVLRVAKRLVLTPGQLDSRSIPQHVKTAVWQRDRGQCRQCGASNYLEFDHIIPLTRGGATSAGNLQLLCRGCNQAKGANL